MASITIRLKDINGLPLSTSVKFTKVRGASTSGAYVIPQQAACAYTDADGLGSINLTPGNYVVAVLSSRFGILVTEADAEMVNIVTNSLEFTGTGNNWRNFEGAIQIRSETDGVFRDLRLMNVNGVACLFLGPPEPIQYIDTLTGLDFTGGAAYGFNRIIAGYEGATVRLIRASDSAESDFGFGETGLFDAAAVVTWLNGSTAKGTVWYDQSGNGNHATQTTDTNRQSYELSAADGKPCFMGGNLNGNYSRYWNLPAGVAKNPQSFASYAVYKTRNRYPGHAMWLGFPGVAVGSVPNGTTLTTDGAAAVSSRPVEGIVTIGHGGLAYKTNGVLPADTVPEVLGAISSSSGVHTLAGTRWDAAVSGAVARYGSQVPAGGVLGRYLTGNTISEGEARAYVICQEHSVETGREVVATLASNHGLPSGWTESLWWVGDSLSAGYSGGNDLRDLSPGHKLAQLQTDYFVRVFARAGKRIDEMDSWATTASGGTNVDRWPLEFGTGKGNVLLWAGYNDFQAGATLATVQGRINTFIANRKAAGFAKVYVGTLIPVGSYISPDSLRTDLNAWLMAGSSDADGVIDFAGQGNWSGKMQGDGVHLLEPTGNAEAARVVNEFLATL